MHTTVFEVREALSNRKTHRWLAAVEEDEKFKEFELDSGV
jgi:hypothetical protein